MATKIQMTIDRQKIEGEITHRSASDITVLITKPYKDVSRGLHIPYFARCHHSFDTEPVDETAKDLLKSIYYLCKYISDNFDSLIAQYLQIKKTLELLEVENISEKVFKSKRIELRKLLRSKQIDNVQYQKRLIAIRKEYEQLETRKSLIWSEFFEEYFPMIVPVGTRDDVLRVLGNNIRPANWKIDCNRIKT